MGIINIHILHEEDGELQRRITQETMLRRAELIDAHRRGEHTFGNMRRDCPLCK